MKKQKTPNRIAYEKEYRRVTSAVRRMKKAGYDVNVQIKKPSALGAVRKRDIDRLKKLTADALYQRATYQGGSAVAERERRMSAAAKKAAETRRRRRRGVDAPIIPLDQIALEKVEGILNQWIENAGARRLKAYLDSLDRREAGAVARKWLDENALTVATLLYEEVADALIVKTQNYFMDSANSDLANYWADYYQEWGEINE